MKRSLVSQLAWIRSIGVFGGFALASYAAASDVVGVRYLALSPDGTQLAFGYRGDLWVVPTGGGKAEPITRHIEMEQDPVWSPDGKQIAFASNRYGNWDIFVVPAEGGESKRLTWYTGSDSPMDWPTQDQIILGGIREEGYSGLFSLNPETGALHRFLLDQNSITRGRLRGNTLLYNRLGFPETRPRYEGSAASQLWTFDTTTGKRNVVRNNRFQHLWPQWLPNGDIVCVTVTDKTPSSTPMGKPLEKFKDSDARTPNVYSVSMNGKAKQLTRFVGGPGTRYLTVARNTGAIAYEVEGKAYFQPANGKPQPIEIRLTVDDKTTPDQRLQLRNEASYSVLSPKNDSVIFVVRGELWEVPVKQGKGPNASDARQLTTWEGLDQYPIYNPSGESIYFISDRDGAESLFSLDLKTLKAKRLTPIDRNISAVTMGPDGKTLAYEMSGKETTLWTLDTSSSAATPKMVHSGTEIGSYAFSPDMQWFAFERSTQGVDNIWIKNLRSGEVTNVTRRNTGNGNPSWSADGKFLYYSSNRDGGGLFAIPLLDPFARPVDDELKYEKPKTTPEVKIDLKDIHLRARRVIPGRPWGQVWSDLEDGSLYYIAGGDIWKADYSGDNPRRIVGGGDIRNFDVAYDKSQFLIQKSDQFFTFPFRQNNPQLKQIPYFVDWTRDVRRERRAALQEFYRTYNDRFYDPNFHGRDWAAIRDRTIPLLDSVDHRNEMATLLNQMVGELESSHSEVSPADGNPPSQNTAHPGFAFDMNFAGPGLKVTAVPPNSPGSFEKTRINVGDVILSINDKPVSANESLYRDVLNQMVGRDLTFKIAATEPGKEPRTVTYRAMSGGEYRGLLFNNLLESREKWVAEKSGGKVAYLHIAGMGQGNYNEFMEEAWEVIQGKKAVIIDVRNNGGGNISDRLIDMIERVPNSYFVPRNGEARFAPEQSWSLPTMVIMGETSFSNAEMFPSAMKSRRLAKLVGMQTPGYVIWTFGGQLVDGTNIRIPFGGSYRLDGTPLENNGEKPDFEVDQTPEQFFAGVDPQLDKAVQEALKSIKN